MRSRARPAGMRGTLMLIPLLALLAACGVEEGPADPTGSADPAGGEVVGDWVLSGGTIDDAEAPLDEGHRITLTINGRTIEGISACNHYGGEVRIAGDGLHMENLSQTEMACAEPAMAAEATYLGALARVRRIERDGEQLVARGDGVDLRFAPLAPPPTAMLVDTRWVLDTVLVGDVAAAPVGEPATLELHADGTFEGSTGCRSFSGDWTERGDQIVAPAWGMDETECPADLAAQDGHVVSVIGDGFIPSVDGDLLTLMDPGGIGLVYRASE